MAFHGGASGNIFHPGIGGASAVAASAFAGLSAQQGSGPFGTGFDPTLSNAFGSPVPAPPAIDVPVVNAGAFTRKADADVQAILNAMGFNAEQVASGFNARGLSRAGGREDAIFRQVVAPGLAQAVGARAQGELGFQNLKIQSALQQAGISTQQWAIMMQSLTGLKQSGDEKDAALYGAIGDFAGAAASIPFLI